MKPKLIVFLVCPVVLLTAIPFSANAIEKDKQEHFQAGLVISSLFFTLHSFGPNISLEGKSLEEFRILKRKEAIKWGLGMAVAVGAAKEILDALGSGNPEFSDFAFTTGGGIVGVTVCLILDYLLTELVDFAENSNFKAEVSIRKSSFGVDRVGGICYHF
jgi:hypothetical protein